MCRGCRQRQAFRAVEGRLKIWGRAPKIIRAKYTAGGQECISLLLASGWYAAGRTAAGVVDQCKGGAAYLRAPRGGAIVNWPLVLFEHAILDGDYEMDWAQLRNVRFDISDEVLPVTILADFSS